MLSCTEINFVLFFFNLEKLEPNPGFLFLKFTGVLVNHGNVYKNVGPLNDFQLTVYYMCSVVWKQFQSNVLNICRIPS